MNIADDHGDPVDCSYVLAMAQVLAQNSNEEP